MILAEHRETLIRLLSPHNVGEVSETSTEPIVDQDERQAIQWVEGLDQAEAEVVVDQARREWSKIVGEKPVVVKVEIDADRRDGGKLSAFAAQKNLSARSPGPASSRRAGFPSPAALCSPP